MGRLVIGNMTLCCALGPSGIRHQKREGDGATPAGIFALRYAYLRCDRVARYRTGLAVRRMAQGDGWCDDVKHASYNKPVRTPFAGRHEVLWRDDELYDCVLVIDHNLRHPRKGCGSAIFLHVAAPGLTPTAGCVALPRPALMRLLPRLSPRTRLVVG